MGFGREDKLVNIYDQLIFVWEQQVEVFERLGQHKRIHSVTCTHPYKTNSAFYPSGVGKLSTGLSAWV